MAISCIKLTGEWATSTASADPMGFLDLARMDWSDDLLDDCRSRSQQIAAPRGAGPQDRRRLARGCGRNRAARPARRSSPAAATANAPAPASMSSRRRAPMSISAPPSSPAITPRTYAHDRAFRTLIAVGDGGYIYESCIRTGTFLVNWMMQELFAVPRGRNQRHAQARSRPKPQRSRSAPVAWSWCPTGRAA